MTDIVRLPTLLDLYDELGPWSEAPVIEDAELPLLMQTESANGWSRRERQGG